MKRFLRAGAAGAMVLGALHGHLSSGQRVAAAAPAGATFALQPATPAMAGCLPGARARVTVVPGTLSDALTIHASHLPPFAGFDLYVTELPRAPFGFSWPISRMYADAEGEATAQAETTLLRATGVAGGPRPAGHLVLFFDDPRDADQCFGTGGAPTTPYNRAHRAGPAVLASVGFPDRSGPLQAVALEPPARGISTPGGGHSRVAQAVTFINICTDPSGWATIRFIDFRLTQGGSVAFWARLDRPAKRMYVYDPTTHRWQSGRPGSRALLSAPYARLMLAASRVAGSTGATGRVFWTVSFSSRARRQAFQEQVRVTDMRDQSQGWNAGGIWRVE